MIDNIVENGKNVYINIKGNRYIKVTKVADELLLDFVTNNISVRKVFISEEVLPRLIEEIIQGEWDEKF